jgi:hypothetical protein
VPPGDIALMGARAARAGIMLRRVETLTTLKHIVARAVWQHTSDHEYLTELATWNGRYGSIAGVPARNTPESDPTSMLCLLWALASCALRCRRMVGRLTVQLAQSPATVNETVDDAI